ncbi:hypothetical protein SNK03_006692 [Fusarium graminearum]|uniref:hypothetical protein n=1 Tax=Gibberella zeae (strain ATCC MYA-4620 / CBS 123657 / FGSC 9075 / NRRL 31084 / PH-1) TaxID=229533 RepID=UPI00021F22E9|nr:hypothetical protein FGSG_12351 [Fusarium graminearum PH-1]ESU09243.1 hypothetical protein FGSG_12351 [Fusarium graminearum PH-1]|eukprot:XP_011321742.1 hypothetical protein FGSG_12351 [Fusarium graminearum PH-1]
MILVVMGTVESGLLRVMQDRASGEVAPKLHHSHSRKNILSLAIKEYSSMLGVLTVQPFLVLGSKIYGAVKFFGPIQNISMFSFDEDGTLTNGNLRLRED